MLATLVNLEVQIEHSLDVGFTMLEDEPFLFHAQNARTAPAATTFHGINEWLSEGGPMTLKVTRIYRSSSPSLVCAIVPPTSHVCPDDHQDGMQTSCPPQYIFSVYVTWPVDLHSEPRFPETRENRRSAHVIDRPRPASRLQSQRKVTVTSS